jgi:hypothetical protein
MHEWERKKIHNKMHFFKFINNIIKNEFQERILYKIHIIAKWRKKSNIIYYTIVYMVHIIFYSYFFFFFKINYEFMIWKKECIIYSY